MHCFNFIFRIFTKFVEIFWFWLKQTKKTLYYNIYDISSRLIFVNQTGFPTYDLKLKKKFIHTYQPTQV